MGMVFKIAR